MRKQGYFLAGEWSTEGDHLEIRSPFDGTAVAAITRGGPEALEEATAAAARASRRMARLTPAERGAILGRAATLIAEQKEPLALAISEEAGKPITLARAEVDRSIDTFNEAASVACHPEVTAQDLGGYASAEDRLALVRRFPIGPVLAITPFNFPLNLVAHKLAPAVAAGCPVVLKPASQTPGPALLLADILHRAGLPPGGLSVIPSRGADAQVLADDDRFGLLTFTGSMDVGWKLKRLASKRRVALELGGNAAVVIDHDTPNLEAVAARIAGAAFGYAGQSCISVQRIIAHEDIYMQLRRFLKQAAENLPTGNPANEETICGPLIDRANADRVEDWIHRATEAGGRLVCGSGRSNALIAPTLLEEVPHDQPVVSDEVFGPVAVLDAFEDFSQAINMVNDSRYGLQAGIFTSDTTKIQMAWQTIEVGGIIQGDVPTWRSDPMPYGGVKDSGTGREGPLHTYREMTEERLLVIKR